MSSSKTRKCSRCGGEYGIEEFDKHPWGTHGVGSTCKSCKYLEISIWRQENKKKSRDSKKRHNLKASSRYTRLLERAGKRGLSVTVTRAQYEDMNLDTCSYCQKDITGEVGHRLNRVNSNKGYSMNNVKACCGDCNKAMLNFSAEDIIQRFPKIVAALKRFTGA